jgi:hypothetical protein
LWALALGHSVALFLRRRKVSFGRQGLAVSWAVLLAEHLAAGLRPPLFAPLARVLAAKLLRRVWEQALVVL